MGRPFGLKEGAGKRHGEGGFQGLRAVRLSLSTCLWMASSALLAAVVLELTHPAAWEQWSALVWLRLLTHAAVAPLDRRLGLPDAIPLYQLVLAMGLSVVHLIVDSNLCAMSRWLVPPRSFRQTG